MNIDPNALGAPPGAMTLGPQGGKKKKSNLPNIIDDAGGKNKFRRVINNVYKFFYLIRAGSKNVGWFLSCISFMYLLPMGVEYMNEQNKIMAKITASMGDAGPSMLPPA